MTCAASAGTRRRDDVATGTPSLKRLLMGDPLSERDAWRLLALGDELNVLLRGVLKHARAALDACTPEAFEQLTLEWNRIISLPADYAGLVSKRGALMFALWREPVLLEAWRDTDGELVDALRDWILPLVMPPFVRGMAQRPDRLGLMIATLADMWEPPRALREWEARGVRA